MKTFNRKMLYFILGIIFISLISLTVVYASLSVVLNISGSSEITASSWNIHLDNVKVKSGSVSANAPVISGNSTLAFDVELNMPGEFYEFTVDVVNEGSIDAMIDSVVKTPELTSEQAKYIKYEITYENGESISTNQILKKGTATPIKVRLEYRKDIVASDLPSSATELSLKLTLVYVQSDGTGSEIKDNDASASLVTVKSGDGTQVGNEVCIKNECFYVISSTDSTITMFSKYNLHVGNSVDEEWNVTPLASPTGIQDEDAKGYGWDAENEVEIFPFIGTTAFSNDGTTYAGSIVEGYVNNYKTILEANYGVDVVEARLISYDELTDSETFACLEFDYCSDKYPWIYSTFYWSGSAIDTGYVWSVFNDGAFDGGSYDDVRQFGVRPVITISREYLGASSQEKMIQFLIDNVNLQAEDGMTWEEWVASDYNTIGCRIVGNYIKTANDDIPRLYFGSVMVKSSELIIEGSKYSFEGIPS